MHILIAPNAFKNSLTATDAALAIEEGLMNSKLICTCECFPIGDGGDGTAELIFQRQGGKRIEKEVRDPFGRPITASFGLVDEGRTAVIEMADASGLRLLKGETLNPLLATSYGTGQLIKYALDEKVKRIIIGLGGSATVDGGIGMLKALGVRFLDKDSSEITLMPDSLFRLQGLDLTGLDNRIRECGIIAMCDVDNKLLGERGAATIFGPQKGASLRDVLSLEEGLSKMRDIVLRDLGRDMGVIQYGGAAGGVAAGLSVFLDAQLVNGAAYFLKLTGFEKKLASADLIITGEGCIDEQTLQGKGPFAVAQLAKEKNLVVIGLAGRVPEGGNKAFREWFDVLLSIGSGPIDIDIAMLYTKENLVRMGREIGNLLAFRK
jgi:glycerate kinase